MYPGWDLRTTEVVSSRQCRVEIERVTAVPLGSHAGLLTPRAVLLGGGPWGAGEVMMVENTARD